MVLVESTHVHQLSYRVRKLIEVEDTHKKPFFRFCCLKGTEFVLQKKKKLYFTSGAFSQPNAVIACLCKLYLLYATYH